MTEGSLQEKGQAEATDPRASTAWKIASVARWVAALAVAVLAARTTGQEACHLTTTTLSGLPASSPLPRNESVSTCTGVGFSDLIGYFLVIAILLLPDAKSIGIGGFRFERLTSKMDEVSKEVGALSQNLNQTFNIGPDALNELRAGLRRQMSDLNEVRDSLSDDERTVSQLALVDDVAGRSDDASSSEILYASITAATLIEEAKRIAKAAVDRSTAVSDFDLATAQDASTVLARLLATVEPQQGAATDDRPDADA